MKRIYMAFVVLSMVLSGSYPAHAKTISAGEVTRVLQAQADQAQAQQRQAHSNLFRLESTWEICDTYQYRQRRSIPGSRAGLKKIVTGCQAVQTVCEAVVTEQQAYVNPDCFYAAKTDTQLRSWKGSTLYKAGQLDIQRYQPTGNFIAVFWK